MTSNWVLLVLQTLDVQSSVCPIFVQYLSISKVYPEFVPLDFDWTIIAFFIGLMNHFLDKLWSWTKIGKKYKLKLLCDHIHLNEKGGDLMEQLAKEFLSS